MKKYGDESKEGVKEIGVNILFCPLAFGIRRSFPNKINNFLN
jgi:hypothetical protein